MPREKKHVSRRRTPSARGGSKLRRIHSVEELETAVARGQTGIFEIPVAQENACEQAARITGQLTNSCEQIKYLGVANGHIQLEVHPFLQ